MYWVPRAPWLKPTEMYSVSVEKARSAKSRCWRGEFLLEALREKQFHGCILASYLKHERTRNGISFLRNGDERGLIAVRKH